jgi:hypothetical protein
LWLSLELGTYTAQTSPEQKKALAQKKKAQKSFHDLLLPQENSTSRRSTPTPTPDNRCILAPCLGQKTNKRD